MTLKEAKSTMPLQLIICTCWSPDVCPYADIFFTLLINLFNEHELSLHYADIVKTSMPTIFYWLFKLNTTTYTKILFLPLFSFQTPIY